ncbi:MAG: amidohydrolase family protein [Candidatus Latescibacteria bacterium]|nr:amidohydrolase family protein [bacterium]MBD3423364.1 amidohydrolase family protein [Candidatus Latescibacterota bacterium]
MKKIFHNGRVITMDPSLPQAEAFMVKKGKILALGTDDEILAGAGSSTRKLDLAGNAVLPAFTDSHTHLYLSASQRGWIDLRDARSAGDIIQAIFDTHPRQGREEWILGRGWDQNRMDSPGLPSLEDLDRVTGKSPLFLERICGHAALVNSAALDLAGLNGELVNPPGGRIVREKGLALDEAAGIVKSFVEPPSGRSMEKLLREAADELLSLGIGGVHDVGITPEALDIYTRLSQEEDFRFRVTGYFPAMGAQPEEAVAQVLAARQRENDFLSLNGVKLFADGSLGARSAALLDDYSDDPGNRGIMVMEPGELYRYILAVHNAGLQAAVHAIGDRANRMVLDMFERLFAESPSDNPRHRIEHAQLVDPSDTGRFARLGIIPSVQFSHCISDYTWIEERIGEARLMAAYPWRSLVDSGCRLAAGSDLPFENVIDPFAGILAAAARTTTRGEPQGGWMPEEIIPAMEAVRAYTVHSAYASFHEGRRGRIAPGMDADFLVISPGILEMDRDNIGQARVLATVVEGEIVYSSPESDLH